MSVLHRVDQVEEMPGPRYYMLAMRLAAYEGVVRARMRARAYRENPSPRSGGTVITTRQQLAASSVPDLISWGANPDG